MSVYPHLFPYNYRRLLSYAFLSSLFSLFFSPSFLRPLFSHSHSALFSNSSFPLFLHQTVYHFSLFFSIPSFLLSLKHFLFFLSLSVHSPLFQLFFSLFWDDSWPPIGIILRFLLFLFILSSLFLSSNSFSSSTVLFSLHSLPFLPFFIHLSLISHSFVSIRYLFFPSFFHFPFDNSFPPSFLSLFLLLPSFIFLPPPSF